MDLIKVAEEAFATGKQFPEFKAGDTITVAYKIIEGSKERIQLYRGVVIRTRLVRFVALSFTICVSLLVRLLVLRRSAAVPVLLLSNLRRDLHDIKRDTSRLRYLFFLFLFCNIPNLFCTFAGRNKK